MTKRQAKIQAHRIASERLVAGPTLKELSRFRTPLTIKERRLIVVALEDLQAHHFALAHIVVGQ